MARASSPLVLERAMAVAAFRPRRDAPLRFHPVCAVPRCRVIVARCSRGRSSFARLCGSAAFGLVVGCSVSVSRGLLGATAPGVVVARCSLGRPTFARLRGSAVIGVVAGRVAAVSRALDVFNVHQLLVSGLVPALVQPHPRARSPSDSGLV
jgi:hypothetical protein